jgi:hypothetical protein
VGFVPTIIFKNYQKINLGRFTSAFIDAFQNTKQDVLTDFETRKNIFYVDWDEVGRGWKDGLDIEGKDLQKAIDEFRKWLSSNSIMV